MKVSKLYGQILVKSTKHIHVFQRINSFVFGHLMSFPFAPTFGQNCISYRIFCALCALMRKGRVMTQNVSLQAEECLFSQICTAVVENAKSP